EPREPVHQVREVAAQSTDPAIRQKKRTECEAGDRGRQGKGKVNQRVEKAPSRERLAHKHPCNDQSEDTIDRRRDGGGREGELEGGHNDRIGYRLPKLTPAKLRGLENHAVERNENQRRQIKQRVAEGQRQPRNKTRWPRWRAKQLACRR